MLGESRKATLKHRLRYIVNHSLSALWREWARWQQPASPIKGREFIMKKTPPMWGLWLSAYAATLTLLVMLDRRRLPNDERRDDHSVTLLDKPTRPATDNQRTAAAVVLITAVLSAMAAIGSFVIDIVGLL